MVFALHLPHCLVLCHRAGGVVEPVFVCSWGASILLRRVPAAIGMLGLQPWFRLFLFVLLAFLSCVWELCYQVQGKLTVLGYGCDIPPSVSCHIFCLPPPLPFFLFLLFLVLGIQFRTLHLPRQALVPLSCIPRPCNDFIVKSSLIFS